MSRKFTILGQNIVKIRSLGHFKHVYASYGLVLPNPKDYEESEGI